MKTIRTNERASGFTLIELMIVVAVISILAAVAVPSYTQYVEKSRRTDATTSLLDCAGKLEREFTSKNKYDSNPTTICGSTSLEGFYNLDVTATATTFSLAATATGAQANDADECNVFSLDNIGRKSAKDTSNSDTTGTCWRN